MLRHALFVSLLLVMIGAVRMAPAFEAGHQGDPMDQYQTDFKRQNLGAALGIDQNTVERLLQIDQKYKSQKRQATHDARTAGHGLEADLSQQGLSVFSNKLGSLVASKLITVVDDSTLPGKRGTFSFDDEGTPSQRTVLVEDGVLKSYMYDRLSAMKDQTSSTGNGRRESYQHRPIPRMTNTFITEGITPAEQVLRSTDKGLLVEKMGGGQVYTVTGDFVFDVQEGYLIEKGSRGEPVRGATLTGNGLQVLQTIDMVGDDLGFSIGTCGKDAQGVAVTDGMPTLRIPEIIVDCGPDSRDTP